MKTNVFAIIAAALAAIISSCTTNYPKEVSSRIEKLQEQGYDFFGGGGSNTIYNYECKHCHTIIQMPDKGPDFFTGKCPYNNNFNHHWERIR